MTSAFRRRDAVPVVSDFQLSRAGSGNPFLERLNSQPRAPHVEYTLFAARIVDPGPKLNTVHEGDSPVSTRSGTFGFSPDLCTHIIDVKLDPGESSIIDFSVHNERLFANRGLLDALLLVFAGARDEVCQDLRVPWYRPVQHLLRRLPFVPGFEPADDTAHVQPSVAASASPATFEDEIVFDWYLSAAENATFTLVAPLGTFQNHVVTIEAPNTSRATFLGPDDIGGVEWSLLLEPDSIEYLTVSVADASDGNWRLVVQGVPASDVPIAGSAAYLSEWVMEDVSEPSARLGLPHMLAVSFTRDNDAVVDAFVEAMVYDSVLNRTIVLELRDGGNAPDTIAGDGIYSAEYLPWTHGNHYYMIRGTTGSVVRETERDLPVMVTGMEAERTCLETWLRLQLKSRAGGSDGDDAAFLVECVQADVATVQRRVN